MRLILITLSLVAGLQLASAQERLSRAEALKYAFAVSADLKQLQGTPIPTDVDVKLPVAVRDGDYGGMVLPEAKLTVAQIAGASEKLVPVGQLWLYKLTVMKDGAPVAESKLRIATITYEGEEVRLPQCTLGVRRAGGGGLELVVLGKSADPLVTAPLKATSGQEQPGIGLEAERESNSGRVTLTIAGKYQAKLDVTQLDL